MIAVSLNIYFMIFLSYFLKAVCARSHPAIGQRTLHTLPAYKFYRRLNLTINTEKTRKKSAQDFVGEWPGVVLGDFTLSAN